MALPSQLYSPAMSASTKAFLLIWESGSREVGSCVVLANTAMYVYDWVLSLSEEVELVLKDGLTWPITIYFLSRVALLCCIFFVTLFQSSTVGVCEVLGGLIGVCGTVSMASTSFLFLLRIRAVYLRSRRITAIFGTLWLVTVAVSIQSAATSHASQCPSKYAIQSAATTADLKTMSVVWLLFLTFFNDTSIFLAITYRLAADAVTRGGWRSCLLLIVKGGGLFSLSRSLMRTGQLYYLSTIAFIWATFVILWDPPVPHGTMYMLAALFASYMNMMACRVFRGVALGTIHMEAPPSGLTSTQIAAAFELGPMAPSGVSPLP
ncbi:hypothetical protein FIBSPDRAFT_934255 [Athelia psychrophila]|uniref:DUF6533 domain-containing protein n=1 Tax=Athelia psychrophila TaxID=1759441 RepID=A0A166FNG8_9AGAM|nr:hypothetical protein FIBSPDRAFT_934255 [Fibularhizoctonia sp. CBS 109695]